MNTNPQYQIVKVANGIVWLIDTGTTHRSVTNAANIVCREIAKTFKDHRIMYRDSAGRWDEMRHKDGEFTGFQMMPSGLTPPTVSILRSEQEDE